LALRQLGKFIFAPAKTANFLQTAGFVAFKEMRLFPASWWLKKVLVFRGYPTVIVCGRAKSRAFFSTLLPPT